MTTTAENLDRDISMAGAPRLIEVAPDLYATKFNNTYLLTFPFNKDALEIIRNLSAATYDGRQWTVSVRNRDILERTMIRMNEAIGERVAPVEKTRCMLPVSAGHEKGDIVEHEGKVMVIEGFGRPFTPNKRRGKPEPEPMRYAYMLPATEAEISAWAERNAPAPEEGLDEKTPDGPM